MREQVLDRLLDGDDAVAAGLVEQVDDHRQRGRLARAGRAGDDHQPVAQERELLGQRPRKAGPVEAGDLPPARSAGRRPGSRPRETRWPGSGRAGRSIRRRRPSRGFSGPAVWRTALSGKAARTWLAAPPQSAASRPAPPGRHAGESPADSPPPGAGPTPPAKRRPPGTAGASAVAVDVWPIDPRYRCGLQ